VGADDVITEVMDEWKAGIGAHDPGRVAAVFTQDAVFQGLKPYGVGRQAVFDYYDSQPHGMTVDYQIRESRSPAADVVIGYLAAAFAFLDRPTVDLAVGVVLTRADGGWRIAQYQASQIQ
jgi:uncharacterized protein (TIGR02246 family)